MVHVYVCVCVNGGACVCMCVCVCVCVNGACVCEWCICVNGGEILRCTFCITFEVRRSKCGKSALFGAEEYGKSAGQLSHGFEGVGGLVSVFISVSALTFVAASAIADIKKSALIVMEVHEICCAYYGVQFECTH